MSLKLGKLTTPLIVLSLVQGNRILPLYVRFVTFTPAERAWEVTDGQLDSGTLCRSA